METSTNSPQNFIFTVSIIGPRQTGKTTLMRSLVTHYTKKKNGLLLT